jgi:hypothetical protein
MIETTYVRLEKAAEMLGTDRDTLLLAAMEGRIQLYGFFGRFVDAYKFGRSSLKGEEEPIQVEDEEDEDIHTFVPVGRYGAIDLFRDGFFEARILSDPDQDGNFWEVDDEGWIDGPLPKPDLKIAIDHIFMKRADIEKIHSEGKTPDAESVPVQKRHTGGDTKKNDTKLIIIAALAKQANIDVNGRDAVKKIEDFVTMLGATASNGTVRTVINDAKNSIPEILKLIPDALERRGK